MSKRRFVVLDRDGTIIKGVQPYVLHPDQVALLPGAAQALRELKSQGFGLVVVTNQPAVGRSLINSFGLQEIHQRFIEILAREGVELDGIYVCIHHPDEGCFCRKPRPGLVERASSELDFDARRTFVIGDDSKDIELGRAVGATTFLVRTGHGRTFEGENVRAHYVVDDLISAAAVIGRITVNDIAGDSGLGVLPAHRSEARLPDGQACLPVRQADRVVERIIESARVQEKTAGETKHLIVAASHLIADSFRKGGKVILCGNGGSAADCQHIAAEFMNTLSKDLKRPALPAIALTTESSFLTAFMNDFGDFENIFSHQVRALGKPGDILIAISTSGNSPNVLAAANAARSSGMKVIALTGQGGRLAGVADLAIAVSSRNTQYIQETHLAIEHAICEIVERELFGKQ